MYTCISAKAYTASPFTPSEYRDTGALCLQPLPLKYHMIWPTSLKDPGEVVLKLQSTTHRVSSVFWRLTNPLKEREGSEIGAPDTKQLHCLLKMMKHQYKRE